MNNYIHNNRIQWVFSEMSEPFQQCFASFITNSTSTLDLIGGLLNSQLPYSLLEDSVHNILPFVIFE